MKNKKVIRRGVTAILIVIISICAIGVVLANPSLSAYSACRKVAMNMKSYAVWRHESTVEESIVKPASAFFKYTTVSFNDGTNTLGCEAIKIGPFWFVNNVFESLVGCMKDFESGETCPEGYFGVSP